MFIDAAVSGLQGPQDPMVALDAAGREQVTVRGTRVELRAEATDGLDGEVRWVVNGVCETPLPITRDPFSISRVVDAPPTGRIDAASNCWSMDRYVYLESESSGGDASTGNAPPTTGTGTDSATSGAPSTSSEGSAPASTGNETGCGCSSPSPARPRFFPALLTLALSVRRRYHGSHERSPVLHRRT